MMTKDTVEINTSLQEESSKKTKRQHPRGKQEAINLFLQGRLKVPGLGFQVKYYSKKYPKLSLLLGILSPIWLPAVAINLISIRIKDFFSEHKPSGLIPQTRALTYYLMKFHEQDGSIDDVEERLKQEGHQNGRTHVFHALQKEIQCRANAIPQGKCNRVGHFISNHHNRDKILKGFNIEKTVYEDDNDPPYTIKDKSTSSIHLNNNIEAQTAINYSLAKVKIGSLQVAYYAGKVFALLAAITTFVTIYAGLLPILGTMAAPAGLVITMCAVFALSIAGAKFGSYNTLMSNSFCCLFFFRDFRFFDKKEGKYKKMNKIQKVTTTLFVPLAITSAVITSLVTYNTLSNILAGILVGSGLSVPPIAAIFAVTIGICLAGLIIHSGLKVIQQKSFGIMQSMKSFINDISSSFDKTHLKVIFITCLLPVIGLMFAVTILDSLNVFQNLPSGILNILPDKFFNYFSTSIHNVAGIPLMIEAACSLTKVLASHTIKLLEMSPLKHVKNPIIIGLASLLLLPISIAQVSSKAIYVVSKTILLLPFKLLSAAVSYIRGTKAEITQETEQFEQFRSATKAAADISGDLTLASDQKSLSTTPMGVINTAISLIEIGGGCRHERKRTKSHNLWQHALVILEPISDLKIAKKIKNGYAKITTKNQNSQ